jgi:iron complex transport system substrate-binding protein
VEELVEIAGGAPLFPELCHAALAKDRIVNPDTVRDRAPEIVLASWCGKKVRKLTIAERDGWDAVPAVVHGHIYEIKSTYILQPGPASLTEGVRQIHFQLCRAMNVPVEPKLMPLEKIDR